MEISEHSQTELILTCPDPLPSLPLLPVLALLGLVISLGGGYLLGRFNVRTLLPGHWSAFLVGIVIAAGLTSLFLIYFMLDISQRRPVALCRLDRQAGTLLLIGRVAWRLWWPQQQTIPLTEVTAVAFHPHGRHDFRLALTLVDGRQLTLQIASPTHTDFARVARVLAAFLDAPLEPVGVMG